MFNFSKKRLSQSQTSGLKVSDTARMIIDENGMILHANELFLSLAKLSLQDIGKRHISSIFNFMDHDMTLSTLSNGLHIVDLHNHGKTVTFQFDWVMSRNGTPLLIGSQTHNNLQVSDTQSRAFVEAFEKRPAISNNNDASRGRVRQRRKSDLIPDLQPFFTLSGDIMIVTTHEGVIVQTNRKFSHFFGDTNPLAHFDEIFHTDDKPYARGALQALMLAQKNKRITQGNEKPQIIDFEAQIILQNGQTKSTEWRGQKTGHYIYFLGQDLTALKSQREALNSREKQLSQAESIGQMGHWNWVVGQDQFEWSDQIYAIFGVERDTFLPTLTSMRGMIEHDDLGRIDQAFQRAIIEQNNYDMEFSIKHSDGQTRLIRCEGRCSIDSEGDVIALYGIMQDITERTIYEQELREARDAAERSYAAKSQFLANMSHELRTPLNAIIGFSDIMQTQMLGPIGNEKYLEYVDGIKDSGVHLLDLISDILDMSKIEAGKYQLDLEELSVEQTINSCLTMVHGKATDSGIALKIISLDDKNLSIIADRRALMQVLLNIMSNAIKFTKEGGSVELSCQTTASNITIKVTDTGIGIPANKLANITRPFEQASSDYAKSHEGSGLGLAITKDLVEMHNGTLKIASEVGTGTIVTITLPRNINGAL